MATEAQLRAQMRRLEKQLADQKRDMQIMQQQILEQNQAEIRRIQQQAQQTYQRKLNETTEAYAQRVRQFQEQLISQNSQQMKELHKQAEELRKQTQQTIRQMEDCNKELRQELKKLQDEASRQDTVFRQAAMEAQADAEAAKLRAAETPHDFFCPQEFGIIDSHIDDLTDLIQRGMYQAAASDAACIATEFQLLRSKVEQAFAEWMEAFEDYRCIITGLYTTLESFESEKLHTSEGSFRMSPRELNFWSSGTYTPLAENIRSTYHTFCAMNQEQILQYLTEQAGTNRRAIFDLVTRGHSWQDQLAAVMNCIISERTMSDMRLTVSGAVAEMLENINYRAEVERFQPPRPQVSDQPWYIAPKNEDPMGSFDLHMGLQGGNRVKLRIIPRRENGLAVGNEYLLTVEFSAAADPVTEEQVAQVNLSRIRSLSEQMRWHIQVTYIPSREKPEKTLQKREALHNTPPNPSEQIRYLERKYH